MLQQIGKPDKKGGPRRTSHHQTLATLLTRFAKNVSISVTIAQAAALANRMNARGTGVTDLLLGVGAISVRRIGRVPKPELVETRGGKTDIRS